jgi:hypothetical protein
MVDSCSRLVPSTKFNDSCAGYAESRVYPDLALRKWKEHCLAGHRFAGDHIAGDSRSLNHR